MTKRQCVVCFKLTISLLKTYRPENPIGVNEVRKFTEINISPNPAKERISVNIRGKEIKDFAVFNTEGKKINTKVINQSENNLELDIYNLSPGMYFVKLYTENSKSFSKSFVVE